jgi:hypothetical protein
MSNYMKEIERQIKDRTLSFEAWLRHVKKLSGKECFDLKCATSSDKHHKLEEEYDNWVDKEAVKKIALCAEIPIREH